MKDIKDEQFFKVFHVSFINEGGTIYGGYLREWMTKFNKRII